MSLVERLMEMNDDAFAPRDLLAFVAAVIDCGGGGLLPGQVGNLLIDLGLSQSVAYDPEAHGDIPTVPGEPIALYSGRLLAALAIGRARLRDRYAKSKH